MDLRHLLVGQQPFPTTHRVEWRCSASTYQRFLDLTSCLDDLDPDDPESECLRDDIRSLPGYPLQADPHRDLIVPVITTVRR